MWTDIKSIYSSAWRFAIVCPLLFLVPVLVEFVQHVMEMRAGMYTGIEQAQLVEADQTRLWFGFAKTLAILLPGYWFVRYVMFDGDAARARALEWPALGLFAVILAIEGAQSWVGLFAPSLAETIGLQGTAAIAFSVAEFLALQMLVIYLFAWSTAWPLGNSSIGPVRSVAIMHGSIGRAAVLMIAAVLPLFLLHFGISAVAIVSGGPASDWALMALDSVVVGFLALTMAGVAPYAARRAAERKGIDLLHRQNRMGVQDRHAHV